MADYAQKFVSIAANEVGTKGSNKHVKYNKWYYGKNKGTPWCSEFVAWCGYQTFGNNKVIPKNSGAAALQKNVVKNGGKWILHGSFAKTAANAAKCKPGDIITFHLKKGSSAISHIGLVEYVSGTVIHTIEGNYSDQVRRGKRSITAGNISAVARPAWPGGTTVSAGTPTKTRTGHIIADAARKLAWPKSSLVNYKYPSGKPTDTFKSAMNQVYKTSEHSWNAWAKKGASCDVFTGTSVRYSGYDKKFPPGLHRALRHVKSSNKWKQVTYDFNPGNLKPGDVMFSRHKKISRSNQKKDKSLSSHIFIYVGNGEIAQASARHYYGKVFTMSVITQRKKESWIKVFRPTSGASDGTEIVDETPMTYGEDTGAPLVLEKEIETLYSSDNYKWLYDMEKEETELQKSQREARERLKQIYSTDVNGSFRTEAPADVTVSLTPMHTTKSFEFKLDRMKAATSTQKLISYPTLVEAPSIELSFNGTVIGGYGNTGDRYPNYITSMQVTKVNGRINTYSITLKYQIRPGEDPNFIDKLLGKTGYTNPLQIRYGDSNSPGMMFKEESAVITDVQSNDDVSSSAISYTISAISSITSADKSYYVFGEKHGKPSTIINDLLYNSGQVSAQLLTAFPAMANRSFVSSNNLIPSTDKEVTVGGMVDVSPLTYLGHVVSCMKNVTDAPSSYFLTYNDSANGAYFNVSEISVMNNDAVYEIDVGYPGDNFVTDFQLCDNIYWPLVYDYNGAIPKWEYDIDTHGNAIKNKTNSLFTNNKFMATSLISQNWWQKATEFPISAKVTLKGLTVPVMLMTYIRVNTLFFGEKDIASGLYVVTDQTDSISGSGYTTTLTLLRVSD